MTLGKVIGTVVSTVKHPVLKGYKLLIVQPVTPDGAAKGSVDLALDTVQAGPGDPVFCRSWLSCVYDGKDYDHAWSLCNAYVGDS